MFTTESMAFFKSPPLIEGMQSQVKVIYLEAALGVRWFNKLSERLELSPSDLNSPEETIPIIEYEPTTIEEYLALSEDDLIWRFCPLVWAKKFISTFPGPKVSSSDQFEPTNYSPRMPRYRSLALLSRESLETAIVASQASQLLEYAANLGIHLPMPLFSFLLKKSKPTGSVNLNLLASGIKLMVTSSDLGQRFGLQDTNEMIYELDGTLSVTNNWIPIGLINN